LRPQVSYFDQSAQKSLSNLCRAVSGANHGTSASIFLLAICRLSAERSSLHSADFYYDVLSRHVQRLDLWTTDYFHALPSVEEIAEWYRGSGLRPYLDALKTLSARNKFLTQYTDRLRDVYPARPGGRVLLPFKRIFVVAYR